MQNSSRDKSIPKQALGIHTKGGRPPAGELHRCIDCGKQIYLAPWRLKRGDPGLRCDPCHRRVSGRHLSKILKHGSRACKHHRWRGALVCSHCHGMVLEIPGNPCICKLCRETAVFITGPFKLCTVCGEARRLASPPETKEPLIIKQFNHGA